MSTVAELVDVAAGRLDEVSKSIALRTGPTAAGAAAAWGPLLQSGQRFMQEARGYTALGPLVDAAKAVLALPPAPSDTGDPDVALLHAAQALGAAADLLVNERSSGEVTRGDRLAAVVQAAVVLAAAAQVTTQATISVLRHSATAASAAEVTHACSALIDLDPQQPTSGRLDQVSTGDRPVVKTGDPVTSLAAAVHDWQHAAQSCVDRADPSSRDLRVAAVSAGRIVAVSDVLLAAHGSPARQEGDAPDATARRSLRAAYESWRLVDQAWKPLVMPAARRTDLVLAAQSVDQAVQLVAFTGQKWAPATEVAARTDPGQARQVSRTALTAVSAVAELHSEHAKQYVASGWVLGRGEALARGVRRLQSMNNSTGGWLPLTAAEGTPLLVAYDAAASNARYAVTAYTLTAGPRQGGTQRTKALLEAIELRGPDATTARRRPDPPSLGPRA